MVKNGFSKQQSQSGLDGNKNSFNRKDMKKLKFLIETESIFITFMLFMVKCIL